MAGSVLEPFAFILAMWFVWAVLRVGLAAFVLLWKMFKT